MALEFLILGPLEVRAGDEVLDLGPRKQRMLLADLCLAAPRVVPTDRLLDDLWGDDADGKENALWVYLSRLRAILEPEREQRGPSTVLVTRHHGYALDIDPEAIDATKFTRAVERGAGLVRDDPVEASAILKSALAMWRGSVLEEFADEPFARPSIARLEELRLGALGHRIDADLLLGRTGELIGELEALRLRHPHREQFVAQRMLALYRSGRQADALRTFQDFRRRLADDLGLDPSPELRRLEEQVLLHDQRIRPRPRPAHDASGQPDSTVNPFKGLRPFDEDDTGRFFGREALVADVMRRISDGTRFIALVGPSGSGKSSMVRAGVVPALRKQELAGPSRHWVIAQMVPGSHPFVELGVALGRAALDAPADVPKSLRVSHVGVLQAALRTLPDDRSRLLLVIDQLEELFTLADDETERRAFLEQLLPLFDDPHGRVVVVAALRSDLYEQPLAYPEFGRRLGDAVVNVVDLLPHELEAAAQQPAERAGVALEPGLLAALVGDVLDQPGALPHFQYALTELFERRRGDILSLDQYRSMGGLGGALTTRAEELFEDLDPEEEQAAQQLMLRLVAISDDGNMGRRRVEASEVLALGLDAVALQGLIERFVRHRLLTVGRDAGSGAPTVEVAHEALLTEWPRLRAWIADATDDVRRHALLRTAMREWTEADQHDDYLLRGSRLDDYEAWATTATMDLTSGERSYLGASVQAAADRSAARARDAADQHRLVQSAKRRLWAVALLLAVVLAGSAAALFLTLAGQPPRVALIHQPNNSPSTQQIIQGLEQASTQADIRAEKLAPLSDAEDQIQRLLETGPDLVITSSAFLLGDTSVTRGEFRDWVDQYPDITFVIVGFEIVSAPNVTTIGFASNEGSFLAGAAAALETETGTIGFVGADAGTIDGFRAGFEAGAEHADPTVDVLSSYLVTSRPLTVWSDESLAQVAAERLYQQGADIVFHAAGAAGVGVFQAARQSSPDQGRHLWGLGVDVDEALVLPPGLGDHVLTSMVKRHDKAIQVAVEAFLDGTLGPELTMDLTNGGFSLAHTGEHLSEETNRRIDDLSEAIVAGAIVVPTLPEGPATDLADPDLTWNVEYNGHQCRGDVPIDGTIGAGDRVAVIMDNRSPRPVRLGVWPVEPGVDWSQLQAVNHVRDVSEGPLPWFRAVAAPGHSHAITFEVPPGNTVPTPSGTMQVGSWAVWCEDAAAYLDPDRFQGTPAGTFAAG